MEKLYRFEISYLAPMGGDLSTTESYLAPSEDQAIARAYEDDGIEREWIKSIRKSNPWDVLVGKTIKDAYQFKKTGYDDEGFLRVSFTDGSSIVISGGYGGYTDNSEGEYPTAIDFDFLEARLPE